MPSTPLCYSCGNETIEQTVSKTTQVKHDGKPHSVTADVPAFVCQSCQEQSFDSRADTALRRQLREDLGLMQPEEITALRKKYGVTQADIARKTCIAAETLSRWINSHVIQSCSHDILLRYYFDELERGQQSLLDNDGNPQRYTVPARSPYVERSPDAANTQYAIAA